MSRKIKILILVIVVVLAFFCIIRIQKTRTSNPDTEVHTEVIGLTEQQTTDESAIKDNKQDEYPQEEEKPVGNPKQATVVNNNTIPVNTGKPKPEVVESPKEESIVTTPENSNSVTALNITQYEKDIIAKLLWLEARGESDNGQRAVVEVILNRVYSAKFPNSVEGVIYQSGQFTPAAQISSVSATAKEYNNVEYVLNGGRVIGDANVCFFSTGTQPGRAVWGKIGNHYFQYL